MLGKGVWIMANAPGHIIEFSLGILLAIKGNDYSKSYLLLALVIFILGNFLFPFYILTFPAIAYLLVCSILFISRKLRKPNKYILFYGTISMYLFSVHGFFRFPYFVNFSNIYPHPFAKLGLSIIFLILVTTIAYILKLLCNPIEQKLKKWLIR